MTDKELAELSERIAVLETKMDFIARLSVGALTLASVAVVTFITLYHP